MKDKMFKELVESIKEAGEIRRGKKKANREFHFSSLDIKSIREKMGLSQTEFSKLVCVSVRTLQNWEQGRRSPEGPARVLLMILKNNPKAAIEAIHRSH